MAEHTPGPWEITYDERRRPVIVSAHAIIAMVRGDNPEPNAKLIAAAPALLAALKAIYEATEPDMEVKEPLAHIVGRIAQEAIEAAS